MRLWSPCTWVDSHFIRVISLFLWISSSIVCSSHSRVFHSYGDVTISGEGLQILTYARHLWPLSSENSLAFHTYYDTVHPFIMVISEDPWHSHQLPSVWQWSCHYLFYYLVCRYRGLNPDLPHRRRTVYFYAPLRQNMTSYVVFSTETKVKNDTTFKFISKLNYFLIFQGSNEIINYLCPLIVQACNWIRCSPFHQTRRNSFNSGVVKIFIPLMYM